MTDDTWITRSVWAVVIIGLLLATSLTGLKWFTAVKPTEASSQRYHLAPIEGCVLAWDDQTSEVWMSRISGNAIVWIPLGRFADPAGQPMSIAERHESDPYDGLGTVEDPAITGLDATPDFTSPNPASEQTRRQQRVTR